jgi:hypothetical protein
MGARAWLTYKNRATIGDLRFCLLDCRALRGFSGLSAGLTEASRKLIVRFSIASAGESIASRLFYLCLAAWHRRIAWPVRVEPWEGRRLRELWRRLPQRRGWLLELEL